MVEWGQVKRLACRKNKGEDRIRLNSDTGSIIGSTYRTKDYVKVYNLATGHARYEYCGSKYDDGFLLSNSEMIKTYIDKYLEK